jgi:outer membrane protein TolC
MTLRRTSLIILFVTLATSCAVGPAYRRPETPANVGYAPTSLPEASSSAPIHGGDVQRFIAGRDLPFEWWQAFQSPALSALVERALKANPSIPAARAALVQAQELVRAQRGFYFPTVLGNLQAERVKVAGNETQESSLGIQANGNNLQEPPAPASPLYYQFYTAALSVGFVPDVFGANRRQVESLVAQRDIQRFALEATYITLASNVVAAAIQEASLRAQIAATQQIIEADTKCLQVLRDQFRLGFAMRIDVAAQEASLAQAETALPPLQEAVRADARSDSRPGGQSAEPGNS